MNTPRTYPISDAQNFKDMLLEDQQTHITSWFAETDHPIAEPKKITDIQTLYGDTIIFWYLGENYTCPLAPKNGEKYVHVDTSTVIHTLKIGEKPHTSMSLVPGTKQFVQEMLL